MLRSEPFKLTRRVYERYVAMRWLRRHWWILAIPVAIAAAIAIACADVRWVIVALMLVLIVWPFVLVMAYFTYLLTPEAHLTAMRKRVTLEPDCYLQIEYLPEEPAPSSLSSSPSKPSDPVEPKCETAPGSSRERPHKIEHINWQEIGEITHSAGCYIFELRGGRWPRFLIVPERALPLP